MHSNCPDLKMVGKRRGQKSREVVNAVGQVTAGEQLEIELEQILHPLTFVQPVHGAILQCPTNPTRELDGRVTGVRYVATG